MLKLYHTYKKKLIPYEPIKKGKVGMYNCGPTVYDYVTIGNLRAYVFEDLLRRSFEYLGYKVTQVMNITDVGHLTLSDLQKEMIKKTGKKIEITDTEDGLDRMEKAAKREGITVWDVAQKYINSTFGKDYDKNNKNYPSSSFGKLNILKPHHLPRATEYVKEQIDLIKKLEEKGYTYKTKEAVYFDIKKFSKYEDLTGQSFEDMQAGERAYKDDPDRKHQADFRLWQLNQPKHEMQWDSPWGKGYPGWHIECSAMSREFLGQPFDIHTGGEDHIKVHHPSEMAQSESAFGKPMANYWMHNAFLTVDGGRMGKSLGNAYTLADIEKKGFDPLDLKYFYLQAHYRTKQNFSWKNLESARNAREKLINEIKGLLINTRQEAESDKRMFNDYEMMSKNSKKKGILVEWKQRFIKALENDINIPKAIAVMWDLVKSDEDDIKKYYTILDFDRVFGLRLKFIKRGKDKISDKIKKKIEELIKKREDARKNKDWKRADDLRDELKKRYNVIVEDRKGITKWELKDSFYDI